MFTGAAGFLVESMHKSFFFFKQQRTKGFVSAWVTVSRHSTSQGDKQGGRQTGS